MKHLYFSFWFALLFLSSVVVSHSRIEIDISKGHVEPLPIAVIEFLGSSPFSESISDVISSDLAGSGLFKVLERSSFIEDIANTDLPPRFPDWQAIRASALVVGRVVQAQPGVYRTEFRLWDIYGGTQIIGRQYATNDNNWRRVAHIISDSIYESLTGEKGYFDTRIVYVDEQGAKDKRIKRLAIMDQDGANIRYLTDGSDLVLTPRFSPTRQEITYMSYTGGAPRVYRLQIATGERSLVGDFPNMTFAPRYSPDGDQVIMSLQQGGNSNIFTMNLRTRTITRLTATSAIDTAPSYSPDGRQVVFESDRGGRQQLYVMDARGGPARRISFGQGTYSTPVWSPRGDLIAFTKMTEGSFIIGVMNTDGSGERILTQGYHNEGPTWSPNGRRLMFFRETPGARGGANLYSIDLTGHNERLVQTPSFASDPAWSPSQQQ